MTLYHLDWVCVFKNSPVCVPNIPSNPFSIDLINIQYCGKSKRRILKYQILGLWFFCFYHWKTILQWSMHQTSTHARCCQIAWHAYLKEKYVKYIFHCKVNIWYIENCNYDVDYIKKSLIKSILANCFPFFYYWKKTIFLLVIWM